MNWVLGLLLLNLCPGALTAAGEAGIPRRVISLAPSITETVIALGQVDSLVACTKYCPVDPGTRSRVEVFPDMVQPAIEALLVLRPDLILVSDLTPQAVVRQMAKVSLPVIRLPTPGIGEILEQTERIGELLGCASKGLDLAQQMRRDLARVESAVAGQAKPRAVIFYGTETAFCAGPGSFSGELLERVGGRNVAEASRSSWPALNPERLLAWNPEVIVVALTGDPAELVEARSMLSRWRANPLWARIDAVATGRIAFVTGSLLMIPGPRLAEAATALAFVLHPGLFPGSPPHDVHLASESDP